MGHIGHRSLSSHYTEFDIHILVVDYSQEELEWGEVGGVIGVIALSHRRSSLGLGGTIGGPWTGCVVYVVCHDMLRVD
jgi:hypothetical protein